jgi:MFS family permease
MGYGLSALTKPLFPLAATPMGILVARVADRVGKGIRGSPRDAMVADFTPPELRGAAFGLRQGLDTVGAIIGPLIAVVLLWFALADLRHILWVACIPALITVLILIFGLQEPDRLSPAKAAGSTWRDVLKPANPGMAFWIVLGIGVALSAARMTEGFLVLKAQNGGLPVPLIPFVMMLMSFVYVVAVYPAGVISDSFGTKGLLLSGAIALLVADVLLAQNAGTWVMLVGIAIWGLHMGLTQGLLSRLVADAAPAELRGTCFGYFNLACGMATLASGVVAGLIWDRSGAAPTFYFGAAMAAVTALGLLLYRPRAATA